MNITNIILFRYYKWFQSVYKLILMIILIYQKATKTERMRIASAKYKQKLIDENRYNKRLEYFREKNYMKRHYYKKPDEFLECIKPFL